LRVQRVNLSGTEDRGSGNLDAGVGLLFFFSQHRFPRTSKRCNLRRVLKCA